MKRSEARELLMQMLYQMNIHNDYGEELKVKFTSQHKIAESQQDYFHKAYQLVADHRDSLDALIDSSSSNWKVNRISQIDLSILRLAVAEILYLNDVPDSASINEAIELGKKYGEENSGKFINGILGKISREKDGEKDKVTDSVNEDSTVER